jgi:thymidylate synthase
MNNLDKQYTDLLQDILDNGVVKQDRTGTGTISVFGRQIRHKMSDGFPLLTTKKMAWKSIVTELLWFLRGDTNIKYLVDNNCHIWDGDAYKNYCTAYKDGHEFYEDEQVKRSFTQEEFINKIKTDDEFAKKWGELGPVYGKQWRAWGEGGWSSWTDINDNVMHKHKTVYLEVDQIQNLINDLKTNPDSRRLMVNAWNVGELDQMVLPPCHYGFQVYTRELSDEERNEIRDMQYFRNNLHKALKGSDTKIDWENIPTRAISLMWNQRSVDTFLGLPFNIASYGLLLQILAKEVNMVPDELIGNLGDVHLYSNHIEQAKEQIGRTLTFAERYKIYSKSDTTWEEGGGNAYGKISALNMMDDDEIPTRTREPYPLPTLRIEGNEPSIIEKTSYWKPEDFRIENYQSHPAIKAPLSN